MTSAVKIPRQLVPTVGLTHGGVQFLEGTFPMDRGVHNFPDEEEPVWKDLHQLQVHQSGIIIREILRFKSN